jgi:hypothetical protein
MKRWKEKWGKYWRNLENSLLNHKIYLDKRGKDFEKIIKLFL